MIHNVQGVETVRLINNQKNNQNNQNNRCLRCRLPGKVCLCSLIPTFNLPTKLLVLMHHRELTLWSNSAHLACLALTHSEIYVRGDLDRTSFTESFKNKAKDNDKETLENSVILFPADDALELTPELALSLSKPLTLIVPDGNWRQAGKVYQREKILHGIPKVKLPPGPPSTYRLRHSPHQGHLSTFEAIARAIGILEGYEIQQKLEEIFLVMVERALWCRGKLKASESVTGIPGQYN